MAQFPACLRRLRWLLREGKVASTENMVAGDPLCEEPRKSINIDVRDDGATRGSSKKSALMDRG